MCEERSEWKGRMMDERWDARKKEGREGRRWGKVGSVTKGQNNPVREISSKAKKCFHRTEKDDDYDDLKRRMSWDYTMLRMTKNDTRVALKGAEMERLEFQVPRTPNFFNERFKIDYMLPSHPNSICVFGQEVHERATCALNWYH